MLTNSSSNIFPSTQLICSFNASLFPNVFSCLIDTKNSIHFYLYTLTYSLIILPLYLFILWLGFQQWRPKMPSSGQTSHTDVFTYYMAAIEALTTFGLFSYSCGLNSCSTSIMMLGYYSIFSGSAAQTFFHCLTCMERYLAVVHPIIYMKLKKSYGVRIRNICIVWACLLSIASVGFVAMFFPLFPIIIFIFICSFIVLIVSFCSTAVFCVLVFFGMGTDKKKWRVFHTIVAITGALVLRFCGQITSVLILDSPQGKELYSCTIFLSGFWLSLPSSLVLPLLFLHRNVKLIFHKCNLNC